MLHRDYKRLSERVLSGEPLSPEERERLRAIISLLMAFAEKQFLLQAETKLERNLIHKRNLAKLHAGEPITIGEVLAVFCVEAKGIDN